MLARLLGCHGGPRVQTQTAVLYSQGLLSGVHCPDTVTAVPVIVAI